MAGGKLRFVDTVYLKTDKIKLPEDVIAELHLAAGEFIETFVQTETGQMEYTGLARLNDSNEIVIPLQIRNMITTQDRCSFYVGHKIGIVRIMGEAPETATRDFLRLRGTVAEIGENPPIDVRLYKHVCTVVRKTTGLEIVATSDVCSLCGSKFHRDKISITKAWRPPRTLKCKNCGRISEEDFCSYCGLKLTHEWERCSKCNGLLTYFRQEKKWFCKKCAMYF